LTYKFHKSSKEKYSKEVIEKNYQNLDKGSLGISAKVLTGEQDWD
jgi:hypothetical protein